MSDPFAYSGPPGWQTAPPPGDGWQQYSQMPGSTPGAFGSAPPAHSAGFPAGPAQPQQAAMYPGMGQQQYGFGSMPAGSAAFPAMPGFPAPAGFPAAALTGGPDMLAQVARCAVKSRELRSAHTNTPHPTHTHTLAPAATRWRKWASCTRSSSSSRACRGTCLAPARYGSPSGASCGQDEKG